MPGNLSWPKPAPLPGMNDTTKSANGPPRAAAAAKNTAAAVSAAGTRRAMPLRWADLAGGAIDIDYRALPLRGRLTDQLHDIGVLASVVGCALHLYLGGAGLRDTAGDQHRHGDAVAEDARRATDREGVGYRLRRLRDRGA